MRGLGARRVVVVPAGVEIPQSVGPTEDPPHVLYVGRLSEEKGVEELAEATRGLPRVVVGDGPLRSLFPDAAGFVPPRALGPYYERAAIVVCPSRREGYGVVAREAMAHGRPVVAAAVGGLVDVVEDGVTGLLVPPGDPRALRVAIERLLGDAPLRERLGRAARQRVVECCSWEAATDATLAVYGERLPADAGSTVELPAGLVERYAPPSRTAGHDVEAGRLDEPVHVVPHALLAEEDDLAVEAAAEVRVADVVLADREGDPVARPAEPVEGRHGRAPAGRRRRARTPRAATAARSSAARSRRGR